ncbi:hypothetical protein GCM10025856_29270 [Methylophaga marina]|uniref:hypothetical protein n=1 Tax=Methylophaga marina TaxID=45495 RepID=UPI0033065E37|nr:hypothetical protein GCM10025856_29270 [Methylophaga marina]
MLLFNQCRPKVLVDCNHDNSLRQHRKQATISHDVIDQRIAGNVNVLGLMLESYIEDGKQEDGHPPYLANLLLIHVLAGRTQRIYWDPYIQN